MGLFLGFSHRSLKDVVFIYLTECFVSRFNAIFYLNCYVEDEEVSMVVSFFLINAIFESLLHLNDYRCISLSTTVSGGEMLICLQRE